MGMLGCTWGCTLKVSGVFILCAVSLVMQWHTICNKFQWMCEGLLGAVCVIGCFCPWGFSESLFPELVVLAAGVGWDLLHNNLINQLLKGKALPECAQIIVLASFIVKKYNYVIKFAFVYIVGFVFTHLC